MQIFKYKEKRLEGRENTRIKAQTGTPPIGIFCPTAVSVANHNNVLQFFISPYNLALSCDFGIPTMQAKYFLSYVTFFFDNRVRQKLQWFSFKSRSQESASTAITKYYILGDLKNRSLFLTVLEAGESKIKILVR